MVKNEKKPFTKVDKFINILEMKKIESKMDNIDKEKEKSDIEWRQNRNY